LDSLAHSSHHPDHIVVVDNSPTPLTLPPTPWCDRVDLIHRPDNPGYGGGANIGVHALDPALEWVVVCNPDILVTPNTLGTLLDHAMATPDVASLGPQIVNEDGTLYPSARAIPTISVGSGHALLGGVWPNNPWTRAYRGDYVTAEQRAAGWLSGAFLLLHRERFDQVGGFDDDYFMFFEDVDLGSRLGQAGFTNWYVPDAIATHIGGTSTSKNFEAMVIAHHNSANRFIASRYPGAMMWPLRAVIGAGLALRARFITSRARRHRND
jgi:N-acetylglucosaminyl-diphospho-decaprenol L-rhamnosyltransferase